ncbi:carbohydrate-binding module family 14 protein [uncultured Lentibacter sp.]|jgi:hypothetical protein|uniref:carbohydrate-binding module family 14 protein n=1 Tax=uncultured Lentibacter sp. TaxID=1659309 RepID=UPI002612E8C0|nr:carbohydrate-binding module family 14 protein [uncultured Lentibacter sp.]
MPRFILTAIFVLTASMASAECSRGHEQAMSCAQGQSYDAETGTCVPRVTS